jgi:plastocyanin
VRTILRPIGVGLLLISAVGAIAACSSGPSLEQASPVPTVAIDVVDNAFQPSVATVEVGTAVTWTWTGSAPHDVAGDGWGSGVQLSGTYEHTFDEAGTYDYLCHVHDGMRGRVVVTDA